MNGLTVDGFGVKRPGDDRIKRGEQGSYEARSIYSASAEALGGTRSVSWAVVSSV